jgi:ATP-binding cassette subfamily F protein uup
MARPSNLLILDEPTNDLDVETLDLLQDVLADYDGTVMLVSHDRDFIDRVATTTILLEGDGRAVVYAGGWSDMIAQRGGALPGTIAPARGEKTRGGAAGAAKPAATAKPAAAEALTFSERKRLEALPGLIARLEAEIGKLGELLADPALFAREPVKFARASEMLAERQAALAAAEEEWLTLAERAGA